MIFFFSPEPMAMKKVRNFYSFIMHDLDLDGIQIFFDICYWFPCENIGLNPELLTFPEIDFNVGCEDYKPQNIEKTIKVLLKSIENLSITEKQKNIYKNWI